MSEHCISEGMDSQQVDEVERIKREAPARLVQALRDEIAEKDEQIRSLNNWIVALIGICFVLLMAPNLFAGIKLGYYLAGGWLVLGAVLLLARRRPR